MPAADPLATYTVADLADLLQVSRRYVQDELITGRRIAYLRVGPKVVRIARPQLESFYGDIAVPLPPSLVAVPDLASWRAA